MPETASVAPKQSDLVPRPDPTSLTTEQLRRELGSLRELIEAELKATIIRIDSMDKASELLRDTVGHVVRPEDVTCLKDVVFARADKSDAVTAEKFVRVDTLFVELKESQKAAKIASDTAIAAAMAAAEKVVGENNKSFAQAVDKSEKAMLDAQRNLETLFKTEIRSTNEMVAIIRSKQDKNEGGTAMIAAIGATVLSLMAVLITGYNSFNGKPIPAPQPVIQYVPAPTATPTVAPAPITVPR